jgi:Cys-rich protein (TIGR01571 family)
MLSQYLIQFDLTSFAMSSWDGYGNGLFGCFKDIPLCLCSILCCPWWIFPKTTAGAQSEKCTVFHCCNPISPWYHRKKLGKSAGNCGEDCGDCLIMIFCCPCSTCQNARGASVKPFECDCFH